MSNCFQVILLGDKAESHNSESSLDLKGGDCNSMGSVQRSFLSSTEAA